MNIEKLAATVPAILIDDYQGGKFIKKEVKPVIIFRDNQLFISAESGDGLVDYYGECNDFEPYIHPDLEKWAENHGMYFDWESPGAIVLCE